MSNAADWPLRVQPFLLDEKSSFFQTAASAGPSNCLQPSGSIRAKSSSDVFPTLGKGGCIGKNAAPFFIYFASTQFIVARLLIFASCSNLRGNFHQANLIQARFDLLPDQLCDFFSCCLCLADSAPETMKKFLFALLYSTRVIGVIAWLNRRR